MSDICICGSVMCGVCVICYICSRQGAFWQTQTNCLLHPTKMNMPPLPVNPTKPKTTELATGCNPGATGQPGAIQGHCPPPHPLPLAPPFWYSQATQGRSPAKRITWPWRLCGIAAILLQKGGEGRGATSLIHDRRCLADRESASSVEGCRHAGLLQVQGSPPRPELLQGHRQFATINVEGKAYVMLLLRRLQKHMEGRLLDVQQGHGCLFSMRRLVELARSHAPTLHAVFVDFDSVNDEVMWRILKARDVHPRSAVGPHQGLLLW